MAFDWLDPEFSATGLALGLVLLTYLVLVEPMLGVRTYAYLRRYRGERPEALKRVYSLTLAVEAVWLVTVGLILLVSGELDPRDLGLRLPTGGLLPAAVGFTVAAAVGQIAAGFLVSKRGRGPEVAGDFANLLPVTRSERRLAGLVAVGAGVSEEVLVRGLLIALAVALLNLPALAAAAVTSVVFGLVHAYQGWLGVLATTLLGAVFAGLYLVTESLLLPIVLHIAVDVRGLLLTPVPGASDRR